VGSWRNCEIIVDVMELLKRETQYLDRLGVFPKLVWWEYSVAGCCWKRFWDELENWKGGDWEGRSEERN